MFPAEVSEAVSLLHVPSEECSWLNGEVPWSWCWAFTYLTESTWIIPRQTSWNHLWTIPVDTIIGCSRFALQMTWHRFLKMELEHRLQGTKTFIDCDDLTDLTRLFSYVGQDAFCWSFWIFLGQAHFLRFRRSFVREHFVEPVSEFCKKDTDTFLILGSPAILTCKWSRLIATRRRPCSSLGPTSCSLQRSSLEATKIWCQISRSWPTIWDQFVRCTESLTVAFSGGKAPGSSETHGWHGVRSGEWLVARFGSRPSVPTWHATGCPVLADPEDTEAMATALVLSSMLKPKLLGTEVPIPSVLEEGCKIVITVHVFYFSILLTGTESIKHFQHHFRPNKPPVGAQVALVICTANCWKSVQVQHWLLEIANRPSCGVIPVIAEDQFLVPSASLYGIASKLFGRNGFPALLYLSLVNS